VKTKTGAFRYRRRVPADIRGRISKTEIVISLHTRDTTLVPLRYARVHAEVERMFAEAKTEAGISNDLLFEAAVRSLRARGLPTADAVAEWDREDRSAAVDVVLSDAGFDDLDQLEEAFEAAAEKDKAKLRQVSMEVAIVQGSVAKPPPTLTHCLGLLLQDKARGRDLTRSDWLNYERERKRIIADLVQQIGNKEIDKVTRADAKLFLTYLEGRGYAPASIKKQVAFLKAMFAFALQEIELVAINPFERLKVVVPESDDDDGVSFTYPEVRTLLSKTGTINDELQDIIRLLACTGARLSEISGLEIKDVDGAAGTISLRYNSIRRLKNKKSIRIVPVVDAQALQALCARLEQGSNGPPTDPVFPRYGRDGGGNSASAALGKWLSKIGLRDPKADQVKTTHSLRHTFKDALREANIHRDVANMLQGHTAGDAASDYGSSELLEAKRQAAEKAWALIHPLVAKVVAKRAGSR
jgi:integrase